MINQSTKQLRARIAELEAIIKTGNQPKPPISVGELAKELQKAFAAASGDKSTWDDLAKWGLSGYLAEARRAIDLLHPAPKHEPLPETVEAWKNVLTKTLGNRYSIQLGDDAPSGDVADTLARRFGPPPAQKAAASGNLTERAAVNQSIEYIKENAMLKMQISRYERIIDWLVEEKP